MGKPMILMVALLVVTGLFAGSNRPSQAQGTDLLIVTSPADSGPGTLRDCLENAIQGGLINFDTAVFPPGNPATIALTGGPLPALDDGNLTIDASSAGVILDGSAGSSWFGLRITSSGNLIKGLRIVHFPGSGIVIDGSWATVQHNTIGGSTPGDRNVISSNGQAGVVIAGSGARSNTVSGNYLGTDVGGAAIASNDFAGIAIQLGATYNLVGGSGPGEGNLISGNGFAQVEVEGVGTNYNTVSGNYIGTDASGSRPVSGALPGAYGVRVEGGAQYNTVGGTTPGERNLISGNEACSVNLNDSGTMHNRVIGNFIGTDPTGTVAVRNEAGVCFNLGSQHNWVEGNLISGCPGPGVWIMYPETMYNVITGNLIGTDASGTQPLGNVDGVSLEWGAQHNVIGPGNVIAYNTDAGIVVRPGDPDPALPALFNTVTRNSIHSNAVLGIDLQEGGNADLDAPLISGFNLGAGVVVGTACPGCTVEVFSDGGSQGKTYEGHTTADSLGRFSLSKPGGFTGPNINATATDAGGNTSEFSGPVVPGFFQFAGWRSPLGTKRQFNRGSTLLVKFLVVDSRNNTPVVSGVDAIVLVGLSSERAVLDDPVTGQWKAEVKLIGSGEQTVTIVSNIQGGTPLTITVRQ